MTNLIETTKPKSDQLNSDDLIGGHSRTIKITKVSLCAEAEQPIAINFEGDNGKPYKPCKSMRRVLVNVWGTDGATFVGKSLVLYRDDKVMFAGVAVGGVRISHMSHIDKPMTMALTASKTIRKPYTVKPLQNDISIIIQQGEEAAKSGKENFLLWYNMAAVKPYHSQLIDSIEKFKKISNEADDANKTTDRPKDVETNGHEA